MMCSTPGLSRMFLVILAATLAFVASSPTRRSPDPDFVLESDDLSDKESPFNLIEDDASLNEMFREVEELMEDTQSKLQNAVHEIEAEEISADRLALKDLPPNYHNESVKEMKVGNDTILIRQEIDKKTDNKTGSTFISESVVSSVESGDTINHKTDNKTRSSFISKSVVSPVKSEDTINHECIVDEDCKPGNYCHFSSFNYKCLPCKEQETCTRDGECCDGELCVWGQCMKSAKGESGTICESQQDCAPGLCCAVHTSLLFPVCTPLPMKGEQCQNPNPLLELFTWELEPEAPNNHCPCPKGLVCQPQGLVSVCEEPSLNDKRDHPETAVDDLPFVTPMPQEDLVYEDGTIVPTDFGVEPPEGDLEGEFEFAPEPRFVDYI